MLHNYIGTEHILLGLMREEKSVAAGILGEKGMRLSRGARGHRPAPEREGQRRQGQGDAAPLGVLPRPDRGRGRAAPSTRWSGARTSWRASSRSSAAAPATTRCSSASRGRARPRSSRAWPTRSCRATCPIYLAEKRILALDISLIVAGTKYRGQFEERLEDDHA